MTLHK